MYVRSLVDSIIQCKNGSWASEAPTLLFVTGGRARANIEENQKSIISTNAKSLVRRCYLSPPEFKKQAEKLYANTAKQYRLPLKLNTFRYTLLVKQSVARLVTA